MSLLMDNEFWISFGLVAKTIPCAKKDCFDFFHFVVLEKSNFCNEFCPAP